MSLTKATYSMISGACINVLDYGAIADGVWNDPTASGTNKVVLELGQTHIDVVQLN